MNNFFKAIDARPIVATFLAVQILILVVAYWPGTFQTFSGGKSNAIADQMKQMRLWDQKRFSLVSRSFDKVSDQLLSIEKSRSSSLSPETKRQIAAEVEKAMAEAGVDQASLSERVRSIIREIAKQSAQAQGKATKRTQAPSSGANSIGSPVSNVTPVNPKTDHILGDPDAPFSLITYDDFECPFCRRHHPTLKKIAKRYAGRVNVVFRQMPLGMHGKAAKQEAMISECVARQGGNRVFWDYADNVFDRTGGNGQGLTDEAMDSLISGLGLDPQSIHDCVKDDRDQLLAAINDDITEGQRLGIRGTPGNVLINNATGKALRINGARPMRQFVSVIDNFMGAE